MVPLVPTSRLRVLVAEDEHLAALVVEDALSDQGHHVVLARDGMEALDIAETLEFDVLLTDLAMPRVTGWELISRLRARRADLPVVVMTGYLPPGGGQALFADRRGPVALLHKPFDLEQLFAALGRVASERAGAAHREACAAAAS
jgi:CheY-like chemotaxis protein